MLESQAATHRHTSYGVEPAAPCYLLDPLCPFKERVCLPQAPERGEGAYRFESFVYKTFNQSLTPISS